MGLVEGPSTASGELWTSRGHFPAQWPVGRGTPPACTWLPGGLSHAPTNAPGASVLDTRDTCLLPTRVGLNATALCARSYFFGLSNILRKTMVME